VMSRENIWIYGFFIRTGAGRLHSPSLGCGRWRDRQFQKNRLAIQISNDIVIVRVVDEDENRKVMLDWAATLEFARPQRITWKLLQ
jgi:hypothetical protein